MTATVNDSSTRRQLSPPTRRVVTVLDALIDASIRHPERRNTLADIVRDTGLPRATTHAIVVELADLGWVHRDDDGTIAIGPGLVATASRVLGADRLTATARPVLADLANSLRMPVFLARRIDDDTVTAVEYAWPSAASRAPTLPVGRRIDLRPPICREFLAWESPATRERWVAAAAPDEQERLRQVLATVAERGYSIERVADEHRAVIDALTTMASVPPALRHRVGALVGELSAIDYLPEELIGEIGAVTVGAPVFEGGRVVASVVACPNTTMSADTLERLGREVVAAATGLWSKHG